MDLKKFHGKYCDLLPEAVQNLGKVRLAPQMVLDAEELEKLVMDWAPLQGWASRQSAVQIFTETVKMDNSTGRMLAGEFCREGASLHVRQKSDGWIVTEVTEGAGEDAIVEPLTFVAEKWLVDRKTGLRYHRYWILDDDDCPKQLFARFKGFVKLAGDTDT